VLDSFLFRRPQAVTSLLYWRVGRQGFQDADKFAGASPQGVIIGVSPISAVTTEGNSTAFRSFEFGGPGLVHGTTPREILALNSNAFAEGPDEVRPISV